MLRYLALLWNHQHGESAAVAGALAERLMGLAPQWVPVLSNPGLLVCLRAGSFAYYATHPVGEDGGQVLGVLFDRKDPQRSSVRSERFFVPQEAREIAASRGRYLVERYWGRYVAFLCDRRTGDTRVLRDPIGDIPCYLAQLSGICIYFASLEDFLQLEATRLSVNWEHIGLRVLTGDSWAEESALNEIECVHAGECIEHRDTRISRQYYWHAFSAARLPRIERLEVAAAESCAPRSAAVSTLGRHCTRMRSICSRGWILRLC